MIDVHTHAPVLGAIYSLPLEQIRANPPYPVEEQWLSVGIHPWEVTDSWRYDFAHVREWAFLPQVKAIGECGLDLLVPSSCQIEVFKAHVLLSEEAGKPLIIHCVKAVDELLAIRKAMKPEQPWIFHGFRGKPQQAEQLLKAGLYLSFGEKFNPLSAKLCPASRLCLETDESALSIQEICQRICEARGEEQESFAKDLFLK